MTDEEKKYVIEECLDGINFEHMVNYYKVNNILPSSVTYHENNFKKKVTVENLKADAISLLECLLDGHPARTEHNEFYCVGHGGFMAEAIEEAEDGSIKAVGLRWSPIYSEGGLIEDVI